VLSGLLSLINRDEGGIGGFLDRFRRAGVGNLVSSWLSGDARPVTPAAVENAIGHDAIDRIGSRAGLSFATAASAIAFMLPKLIQRLAPGGAIPSGLSADVASYMGGPAAAVRSGARTAASAVDAVTRPRSYLWPVVALLAAAALLLLWLVGRGPSTTSALNVDEQIRQASARASAALSALRPGFSAQDLVSAVNLNVINFSTGSAEVPAGSYDFLNRAAAAFKAAPAGTVVEVGGHTDNVGNSAANLQLSQQRADAIRNYLVQQGVNPGMLTTKGYGDTRPLSTNDTDAGRFRNRRIEFTVR